jgi:hypothetical protein
MGNSYLVFCEERRSWETVSRSQNKIISPIVLGSFFVIARSLSDEAISSWDCRALINQSSQ